MTFSWNTQSRPILALAPMAGYTDSAYRQLIKGIEPTCVCFTEFTSTVGIIYGNKRTLKQLDFNPKEERPIVAQIFGKNPTHFQEVAKVLEQMGVDAIDINMGCPSRKVVSSDHGSALLNNPSQAAKIVEATVAGTSLPVSVKTRIGAKSYNRDWFIQFGKDMVNAGAKLLTIHGRTAKQMYTGLADWEPIYELKRNVSIPVIGNGDIKSAQDALDKIGNLDGVMVGRGTMNNPWLMAEIAAAFEGRKYSAPKGFEEKLPIILKHCELIVDLKGEKLGILNMRKHLMGSLKGFARAKEYRTKMVQLTTLEETKSLLYEILGVVKGLTQERSDSEVITR